MLEGCGSPHNVQSSTYRNVNRALFPATAKPTTVRVAERHYFAEGGDVYGSEGCAIEKRYSLGQGGDKTKER